MKFKKFALSGILLAVSLIIDVRPVFALTIPSFPACASPQGDIKANYSSGTHGIVGNSATYTGSDSVYTLSSDTLTQCFCSDNGQGIQTNWWKASSLSDSDIQILKNQGWFYVPDGALWGLSSDPYVASNSNYTCKGGTGGGEILGASASNAGSVLGLANTGDSLFIYSLFSLGILSLIIGFTLRPKQKMNS